MKGINKLFMVNIVKVVQAGQTWLQRGQRWLQVIHEGDCWGVMLYRRDPDGGYFI